MSSVSSILTMFSKSEFVSVRCVTNRFGRKKVFFLTTVLHAVTALLQAASVNWIMFAILNLLRGCSQNYSVSHILGKANGT